VEIVWKIYFDNVDVIEKNLKYFMESNSDICEAYENYGRLVHEKGGPLDEKHDGLLR